MTHSPLPPILAGAHGLSRALYSNWLWVKSLKLQIDCGDGAAIGLGRNVGSPRWLALTHGHSDHLLGLPNVLGSRQFGSMTSGGPLHIIHPPDCPRVAALRRFVDGMWEQVAFDRITWLPLAPGMALPLDEMRTLIPFATQHVDYLPSQGYAVRERRRRLTAAARALPASELRARIAAGEKAALEEEVEHTVFAHTGDTMPIDHPHFDNADVLVYDATFLDVSDRDYPSHAAVPEVLEIAAARRVKALVLHHVSRRYDRATLVADMRRQVAPYPMQVWLWDDEEFTAL